MLCGAAALTTRGAGGSSGFGDSWWLTVWSIRTLFPPMGKKWAVLDPLLEAADG